MSLIMIFFSSTNSSVGCHGGITDNRATVVLTWWLETTVPTMQRGSPEGKNDEKRNIFGGFQKSKRKWAWKIKAQRLWGNFIMSQSKEDLMVMSLQLFCAFLFFTCVNHKNIAVQSPSSCTFVHFLFRFQLILFVFLIYLLLCYLPSDFLRHLKPSPGVQTRTCNFKM